VLEEKTVNTGDEVVHMKIVEDTEQEAKIKQTQSCASAFCNCNFIRGCVRGKKNLQKYGNIDLDMTYITKHIVAAGFPATGVQAFYRNKRSDLVAFLQSKHGNMIKIYNLCAEPEMSYTSEQVGGISVGQYPFKDHNVCSVQRMVQFCLDSALFL